MINIKERYLLSALILVVIVATSDLFLINTGDFYRLDYGFMNDAAMFNRDLPLIFNIKPLFLPLWEYDYKSSYTVLVYCYAWLLSWVTPFFDMRVFASLQKAFYIASVYLLFSCCSDINKKWIKFPIFIICCIPLLSSSILSFSNSLYQEQALILFMPLLMVAIYKRMDFSTFLILSFIACSKSQFFYLPLLMLVYYVIYDREHMLRKLAMMIVALGLAVSCIVFTTTATTYNKYHSAYFGVYALDKYAGLNKAEYDKDCAGVDAWGNVLSLEEGAIPSDIGESCFKKHPEAGFKSAIQYIAENPMTIITLLFDKNIKSQMDEDYFHVYKSIKVMVNDHGFTSKITHAKQKLYGSLRPIISIIILIASVIFFRNRLSGLLFLASATAISQFYIAFIGEGYRDLAKHLMPMNFSFDMSVFILCILLISALSKKLRA
ncbi:hypothetical protein QNY04_000630 [Escherichia coli]|uniref:hypothetical protein n=1 Tax=Escherichia coli TaxID=562 RepID=UPI001A90D78E|nr:hypothetical protein [Escherichia coli]ELV4051963.1 hypothetical protein [Escherichia coli]MBO0312670.1 hypothetical protein [Escherichia coli]